MPRSSRLTAHPRRKRMDRDARLLPRERVRSRVVSCPSILLIAEWRHGTWRNAVSSCLLIGIGDFDQNRFRPWPPDELQAARQVLIAVSHRRDSGRPVQGGSDAN